MSTKEKIIQLLEERKEIRGADLADLLGISSRAVRKQLKNLLNKELIEKVGLPPRVYYRLKDTSNIVTKHELLTKIAVQIDNNFLTITPKGEIKKGADGFIFWCDQRNLDIGKTAINYIQTIKKYKSYKKNGLINGMSKFKQTFPKVYLDQVFYIDFYSIERFGKTKLGQLLLYAKQSQDKKLIKMVFEIVGPQIGSVISRYDIDATGFIPPTVKREVQFIKELEKYLSLDTKVLNIEKIKTNVIIPQKTLSKLQDRVINAKETFVIQGSQRYKNILLIDDAIGSGATLNEIAKKIREKNLVSGKIIGLSLTGSFKGFDVISEV